MLTGELSAHRGHCRMPMVPLQYMVRDGGAVPVGKVQIRGAVLRPANRCLPVPLHEVIINKKEDPYEKDRSSGGLLGYRRR